MLIGIVGTAVVGVAAWVAAGLWIKRGVEEPAFEVVSRDGEVEVRRYAPTVVAVTVVEGEREAALNEGFRRLAGYIFGKNRSKQEIAMTTPVSATRSERIAMTAPVSASPSGVGSYRVTFTMPPGSTLESLPEPEDPRVVLEAVPSRDQAAVRFSGWARTASIEHHTAVLTAWAERTGHQLDGAPTLAQYDPPFTMPLLRRNEILVTLRDVPR
jgi:hypothetical protein